MKKWMMIVAALAVAAAVQAETMTGIVYAKGSSWKIGKQNKSGEMSAVANFNKADYAQAAALDGKTVEVTGELDPASKFPSFQAGVTIKVVE